MIRRFTFVLLAVLLGVGACRPPPPPPPSVATTTTTAWDGSEDDYATICAGVPLEAQSKCPLGRWTRAIEVVPAGVVLHLRATAPRPEDVERRVRCHRAWMAEVGGSTPFACPLGAPGLVIRATQGKHGTDLALVAASKFDIEEIRRRARAVIED